MVQLVSGSYSWSLVLSSWASLISSTAGASSAWITVDHVYGLVARLFQTVNTKVKQCLGSPSVSSIKCFWSLSVSPSWMLISFHFEETLLATSFIRSDSSGSLSSPAYLLPKPARDSRQSAFHIPTELNGRSLKRPQWKKFTRNLLMVPLKLYTDMQHACAETYFVEQNHFLLSRMWTSAVQL